MKRLVKNIGIGVVVIVILAFTNRWYLGGFKKVVVLEQNIPAYIIAYIPCTGEYSNVGSTMTKVYEILSGAGVTSFTGVGIYYDNSAIVSGTYFRSDIGAVITAKDAKTLVQYPEIKVKTIPSGKKIITEFPLKSSVSFMAGSIKIYPILTQYLAAKGYNHKVPMMELYDTIAKKIYYIMEITK